MSNYDLDELRRVANNLDALGMKNSAARIRAAIEINDDERIAPVQDEPRVRVGMKAIPWGLHVMLWRIYADNGHGSQSAKELADRGGFSRKEIGGLAVGLYTGGSGSTIPLIDLYNEAKVGKTV